MSVKRNRNKNLFKTDKPGPSPSEHPHSSQSLLLLPPWVPGKGTTQAEVLRIVTSVGDLDVHGELGGHGQEVVLKRVLHQPLLLLRCQGHLLLRGLPCLQLLTQLLQHHCL